MTKATKRPARSTAEIHRMIADQAIKAMETSGTAWVKSWSTSSGQMPTSMSTGRNYQGINLVILGLARAAGGYGSHEWGTFKQWRSREANVRKGQKATTVILYKPIQITDKVTGEDKTIGMLKTFSVFNADQVDGYETPAIVDAVDHTKLAQPNTLADQLASRAGCDVRFNDPTSAFYAPMFDFVNMPRATQFATPVDYAATLLHELAHWTGHKSRLDRKFALTNGSKDYAKEELVAELASAMMCGSLGITPAPREDHAKYLANWMQRLKDEPKIIFSAAAKANQAAEWIFDAAEVQQDEVAIAA